MSKQKVSDNSRDLLILSNESSSSLGDDNVDEDEEKDESDDNQKDIGDDNKNKTEDNGIGNDTKKLPNGTLDDDDKDFSRSYAEGENDDDASTNVDDCFLQNTRKKIQEQTWLHWKSL